MFTEGHVDAGGLRLRYLEAGQGTPLVHLSGPDSATRAQGLLARQFRVIVLEPPPGVSADGLMNAIAQLGLDAVDLMAASSTAETAVRLALHAPDRVRTLVLEAPDAIRKWRTLMGATDPAKAESGTLRREFGASIEHNATHGSDAPETAAFELGYFFRGLEL